MRIDSFIRRLTIIILLLPISQLLHAAEIRIAVASNFSDAMKTIAGRYEQLSGHKIILAFGSTGKHYAQIRNGAPFDAYFAADVKRPQLLDEQGIAIPDSRFAYAIGKIILWSPKSDYIDPDGIVLKLGKFRHLAIANPKLAPYGVAAREVLQSQGLWEELQGNMVRGENISQALQFVKSGNAELGFIAYSQIKHPAHPVEGSYWDVPQSLYSPIEQQAVLLKDSTTARDFISFVKSAESMQILRNFGYGVP